MSRAFDQALADIRYHNPALASVDVSFSMQHPTTDSVALDSETGQLARKAFHEAWLEENRYLNMQHGPAQGAEKGGPTQGRLIARPRHDHPFAQLAPQNPADRECSHSPGHVTAPGGRDLKVAKVRKDDSCAGRANLVLVRRDASPGIVSATRLSTS